MKLLKQTIKKLLPSSTIRAIEPFGHKIEAMAIASRYGMPAKKLRVIGVTGTNGKTTTCFMIHKMMREAGLNVALMTTVAYGVNDDITPQIAHMTTVSAPLLNKRMKAFVGQGAEWLVLETTSHALAQSRVWGVPYEIAVVTNVTHEHLDYHGSFEAYAQAKEELFKITGKHPNGFGVVNADDKVALSFAKNVPQYTSYGINNGDLQPKNLTMSSTGSSYVVQAHGDTYNITCNIPGEFNVSNSLAAVAVGRRVGLSVKQIEKGIAALNNVEGRMTTIQEGQAYAAIVDFAHTPDSFERLLGDLRKQTKGKLVAVFGSAGRRDKAKRAIQGEIAGRLCDEVVLTEEDDRDCDGNDILRQIAKGAEEASKIIDKNLFLVLDRTEAIAFALTRVTTKDDTVVFLGKGHEKTIERADGEHKWDEIGTVKRAVKQSSTKIRREA